MKPSQVISWTASLGVAGLLGFTGVFKLAGNADAQAMFKQIGGSAAMYFTGAIELIAAVLILLPKTRALGGPSFPDGPA